MDSTDEQRKLILDQCIRDVVALSPQDLIGRIIVYIQNHQRDLLSGSVIFNLNQAIFGQEHIEVIGKETIENYLPYCGYGSLSTSIRAAFVYGFNDGATSPILKRFSHLLYYYKQIDEFKFKVFDRFIPLPRESGVFNRFRYRTAPDSNGSPGYRFATLIQRRLLDIRLEPVEASVRFKNEIEILAKLSNLTGITDEYLDLLCSNAIFSGNVVSFNTSTGFIESELTDISKIHIFLPIISIFNHLICYSLNESLDYPYIELLRDDSVKSIIQPLYDAKGISDERSGVNGFQPDFLVTVSNPDQDRSIPCLVIELKAHIPRCFVRCLYDQNEVLDAYSTNVILQGLKYCYSLNLDRFLVSDIIMTFCIQFLNLDQINLNEFLDSRLNQGELSSLIRLKLRIRVVNFNTLGTTGEVNLRSGFALMLLSSLINVSDIHEAGVIRKVKSMNLNHESPEERAVEQNKALRIWGRLGSCLQAKVNQLHNTRGTRREAIETPETPVAEMVVTHIMRPMEEQLLLVKRSIFNFLIDGPSIEKSRFWEKNEAAIDDIDEITMKMNLLSTASSNDIEMIELTDYESYLFRQNQQDDQETGFNVWTLDTNISTDTRPLIAKLLGHDSADALKATNSLIRSYDCLDIIDKFENNKTFDDIYPENLEEEDINALIEEMMSDLDEDTKLFVNELYSPVTWYNLSLVLKECLTNFCDERDNTFENSGYQLQKSGPVIVVNRTEKNIMFAGFMIIASDSTSTADRTLMDAISDHLQTPAEVTLSCSRLFKHLSEAGLKIALHNISAQDFRLKVTPSSTSVGIVQRAVAKLEKIKQYENIDKIVKESTTKLLVNVQESVQAYERRSKVQA